MESKLPNKTMNKQNITKTPTKKPVTLPPRRGAIKIKIFRGICRAIVSTISMGHKEFKNGGCLHSIPIVPAETGSGSSTVAKKKQFEE
ncbi:hypothetical protein LIER_32845 [Lithospermum erythrorhizon]|uniref:Uncharacterized protein n=1 Tax=Lithospermum erythrorhizon TaxID=34254 RepID=A0AAV3RWD1_LITER